jgi:protein gp37
MTLSKIQWCDRSDWNPVRGCTRVSPGCGGPGPHGGCYAEGIAARFSDPGQPFHGFAKRVNGEARWTGKVALIEDRLLEPIRWRNPARVFALSMSDLFHENLPMPDIIRVMAVIALCPHLTFQVLTKRSERMRDLMNATRMGALVWEAADRIACDMYLTEGHPSAPYLMGGAANAPWPLPNLWLGVSCEDQARADERIPDLLATPAAVRFISAEPLLGPIDLTWIAEPDDARDGVIDALLGCNWIDGQGRGVAYRPSRAGHQDRQMTREVVTVNGSKLDWVIIGGESGPRARDFHLSWAKSLIEQCQAANVPAFMKQVGSNAWDDISYQGSVPAFKTRDRKGGSPDEWPACLQVREMPA